MWHEVKLCDTKSEKPIILGGLGMDGRVKQAQDIHSVNLCSIQCKGRR